MAKFYPTIGIETHVQLKTKTKLFAAVGNDARDATPNSLISHICVGMPGALPVLNENAVKLASKAAVALGTRPQAFSKFDRKHYFYPDLPKGYQISQYDQPIIIGGQVEITVDGQSKAIAITRAHLEEDAGKNTHPDGADYSLVDLNRAGTPLLEIVSEPEIHTAQEAKAYARELYLIMKYAGVSDCDLNHGNMRFDVNVSLSADPHKLGTRSEVKNLNSFRSVENAVAYEIKRQSELLNKGEAVIQETRGWDEAKQKTTSQRGKEEAHDYRYMPEPDVPPIELDDKYIDEVVRSQTTSPMAWRAKLKDIGIDTAVTETILEIEVENEHVAYLELVEGIGESDKDKAKHYLNWAVNVEAPARRDNKLSNTTVNRLNNYDGVYDLFMSKLISSNSAYSMLVELLTGDIKVEDYKAYAEEKGYLQQSDENEIESIVEEVISENGPAVQDVKNGEQKAIGFLVGQVMAKSKGQANPSIAQQIIKRKLNIEN